MTIKQQGGVFGRNPTFNDVTIEGTLTFDGDVDINSDLQVDGELIVNRTAAGFGTAIEIKNKDANAGQLAIDAGYLTIGKGDVGILFQDGGNAIQPRDVVGLTNSNGLIDLGVNGARFKNLFLAENVVVGSGYGIDFSATAGTGTSELFDDYEEGTFVPSIQGNVVTGAGTYTTQEGVYTKIGNIVTVYANVTWSAHTGSGTGIRLAGLPFTSNATYGSMLNGQISDITLSANNYFTGALVRTSDTRVDLFQSVIGGTSSGLISFDTSGTLRLSGHYYI